MKKFSYDDLTMDYDFAAELAFTEAFQKNQHADIAVRELECLKVLLPSMMLPIEPGDWFVGRRKFRLAAVSVGFPADRLDHVGFSADITKLEKLFENTSLTGEAREKVRAMIDFWRTETCVPRMRRRFSKEMLREMPQDDWDQYPGAVFALYRLAGAQLDFDKLIRLGFAGLIAEIEQSKTAEPRTEKQLTLLTAMQGSLRLLLSILVVYETELDQMIAASTDEKEIASLTLMRQTVRNLQIAAPKSFHEELQLVWLYMAFSGTYDFGRCDEYFGDLYANGLDDGTLTHDQALDYLLSFYRLAKEVISRDTRMILGGRGRRNAENADRFALIAMEACAIHHEAQPQLSLRMYEGMSEEVRTAAMDLLATKMTYPLLFNDEASIPAVQKMMRVSREEAEQYAFFGCGEYVLNHRSMGTPNAIINLLKVLEITLHNGYDPVAKRESGLKTGNFSDFKTFEELFSAYQKQVEYFTELAADAQRLVYDVTNENAAMLYMSILNDDCIGRAKAALDGGIRYLAGTYETYGNVSTADSLTAIKRVVYEEKRFTQDELLVLLDANFKGSSEAQSYLISQPKFGNENDEADEMVKKVDEHICDFTAAQADRVGLASFLVVIINNSANMVLGKHTAASADGRSAYTYMSNGNCPTAGMDKSGLTAMLNSVSRPDVSKTAGAAQNIKLNEDLFTKHRDKLHALIDAIFDAGLLSLSVSVVGRNDLEQATLYPERYQNLFVRVGGFSARFVNLNPEVKRDMLNRTLY